MCPRSSYSPSESEEMLKNFNAVMPTAVTGHNSADDADSCVFLTECWAPSYNQGDFRRNSSMLQVIEAMLAVSSLFKSV